MWALGFFQYPQHSPLLGWRDLFPFFLSSRLNVKLSSNQPNQRSPMRPARLALIATILLFFLAPANHAQSDKLTVMGKLTRVVAIGAETTGWAIDLNPVLTVNGKQVSSIEIKSSDPKKLEALENKTVKAIGKLSNALGVESGERPVLTLSSIREIKAKPSRGEQPSNY
jgi:hypothetical protein